MTSEDRSRPVRHVGDVIGRLAGELGLERAQRAVAVQVHWDAVVGDDVAAHAWPARLRDGVLVVEVESPAWATQVRYLGARIVEGLNEALGEAAVTEIRTVVARGERPGRDSS